MYERQGLHCDLGLSSYARQAKSLMESFLQSTKITVRPNRHNIPWGLRVLYAVKRVKNKSSLSCIRSLKVKDSN